MPVVIDGTTGVTAAAFDGAVDGADLTGSIAASLLTGALPALNGSALTNLPAPTSAQVGTATAGLALGAVGSYAWLCTASYLQTITAGSTYAGSDLRPAGFAILPTFTNLANVSGTGVGSAQTGTWRAMGSHTRTGYNAEFAPSTVFLRIS
jgi:hypothetical protein